VVTVIAAVTCGSFRRDWRFEWIIFTTKKTKKDSFLVLKIKLKVF